MSNQPSGNIPAEIHVTDAWIRFIRYCQQQFPHGELTIKMSAGEPTFLVSAKPVVRFDRPETIPPKVTDFSMSG